MRTSPIYNYYTKPRNTGIRALRKLLNDSAFGTNPFATAADRARVSREIGNIFDRNPALLKNSSIAAAIVINGILYGNEPAVERLTARVLEANVDARALYTGIHVMAARARLMKEAAYFVYVTEPAFVRRAPSSGFASAGPVIN